MRARQTLPLFMTLLIAASPFQLSPAQARDSASLASSDLQTVIYNQEHRLAKAEQQKNRDFFNQSLDDALIYVAFNGLVFTKQQMMRDLTYIDVSDYEMENVKVRALGSSAALVTYDLKLKGKVAGHDLPSKQYASSVWVRDGHDWRLIFHQSTPAHHG
jgi:hypothetical protein